MKHHRVTWFISVLVVLLVILAGCSGSSGTSSTAGDSPSPSANTGAPSGENGPPAQDPVTLTFGSWVPATNPAHTKAFDPWAEHIQEATEGIVTIDMQAGGVLGGSLTAIQDVSGGVYDIGYAMMQYYPDTPLFKATVLDLPFAFANTQDHLKRVKVAQRYVQQFVEPEIEKLGLKLVGVYFTDPVIMMSPEPIRTVDDLSGKRILMQSPTWEGIIRNWGGTPVAMSIEDLYTALERGTIDVGIYSPAGLYPRKFHEPAPYITRLPIAGFSAMIMMNPDKFNGLSPEMQKRFDEEFNPMVTQWINENYAFSVDESLSNVEKEIAGKGEMINLTDEQLKGFMEAGKDAWLQWIDDANSKGYDGQALMDGFLTIMEEEGIEPPYEF